MATKREKLPAQSASTMPYTQGQESAAKLSQYLEATRKALVEAQEELINFKLGLLYNNFEQFQEQHKDEYMNTREYALYFMEQERDAGFRILDRSDGVNQFFFTPDERSTNQLLLDVRTYLRFAEETLGHDHMFTHECQDYLEELL